MPDPQEPPSALRVMHIGRSHVPGDGKAQCIDEEVALPAFDELAAIKAAVAPRFLDRLHALAVHDGRAQVWMPPDALTLGSVQGRIERMQDVLATELPEMVEHGLPRREIAREITLRTAGAQHIENGVEDATQWVRARSAAPREW
jgi:hypothetical protein